MKISIITTFTAKRGDPWKEALNCFSDFADEVIAVYDFTEHEIGEYIKSLNKNIVTVHMEWPDEYSWEEFPKHHNEGLFYATGDWVIKLNIDYLLHEKDFERLRECFKNNKNAVASLNKISIYNDRYFSKGQVICCLNRREYPNLRFGGIVDYRGNDDLDGIVFPKYITSKGVPMGELPKGITKTGINFWNFDYTFKNLEESHKQFARMARAYKRYFNSNVFGKDDNEAIIYFDQLMKTRYEKTTSRWQLKDLPKYIHGRYK